ncbi:MAG: VWA domain-containing protein [Methylovirgula sp.]
MGTGEKKSELAAAASEKTDIDRFLAAAANLPARHAGGRLVFALDATMSRQPTWDLAQSLQAEMFAAATNLGGLAVQLVYYRGFSECRASQFVDRGEGLAACMMGISVRAGRTQIGKVLRHVRDAAKTERIGALVFIGDAMEEQTDDLARLAGELRLLGVKAFMFQEGRDRVAEEAFRHVAFLTGGAYATFDSNAAQRLKALLGAAAAYAAGGLAALEARAEPEALLLLSQMR